MIPQRGEQISGGLGGRETQEAFDVVGAREIRRRAWIWEAGENRGEKEEGEVKDDF